VIWILVRNCSPCSARLFLYTVPNLPGTRSTQAGRGVILPSGQGHDAGEFTRVPAASVLAVPHVLINPQHLHPTKNGRNHQMWLADTTRYGTTRYSTWC